MPFVKNYTGAHFHSGLPILDKIALLDLDEDMHGELIFGRMIPAVRSLISIPAGMSHMPFGKFMSYSTLGTIIWTSFLACVGYYFGNNTELMHQIFSQVGYVILSIVVVIIFWIF